MAVGKANPPPIARDAYTPLWQVVTVVQFSNCAAPVWTPTPKPRSNETTPVVGSDVNTCTRYRAASETQMRSALSIATLVGTFICPAPPVDMPYPR